MDFAFSIVGAKPLNLSVAFRFYEKQTGKTSNMTKKRNRKVHGPELNLKASEMLAKCADGFIAMGDTIEQKQSNLNLACTAWNLTLLPKDSQKEAIDNYIRAVYKSNPVMDEADCNSIRHNIDVLMEYKLKYFPKVNRKMLGACIEVVDGKGKITVLSMNLDQFNEG